MINMQTIVDNAIDANLQVYKKEARHYYTLKRIADTSKTKKDIRDFSNMASSSLNIFSTIEDTLIRLFPDFDEYITERLVRARLEVKTDKTVSRL